MAIKEHIGYPDHILQESNQKLDQEYTHVSSNWGGYPAHAVANIYWSQIPFFS